MPSLSFLSNPLFSTIVTLYTLILLYFPRFISSPVPVSTLLLSLSLLRLGATQKNESKQITHHSVEHDPYPEPITRSRTEPSTKFHPESFVEWDVRAPLEIIYEECEGEEAEQNDDVPKEMTESEHMNVVHRYASLSSYYPESDTDASSEGDFPATEWEEEDDMEGLIEISLDDRKGSSEIDEDNLIEIDLFPAR